VVRLLRTTGLLQIYDTLKFHACVAAARSENRSFVAEFPHVTLPPLDLMYDAYAHVRYRIYHDSGRCHAEYLVDLALKFADSPIRSVLEWGCGPARVLRHIPSALGSHIAEISGTDYNAATIDWCRRTFPALRFVENRLEPPLLLPDNSFDFAYALSVFTHLSEPMHTAWRDELHRVVRPGGLLIATLHGDWYRNHHLLPDEQRTYDEEKLVVRGRVSEGRKWFAAFHSPAYVRAHFSQGWDIVHHAQSPLPGSIEQDVWVFRKPLNNRPPQAHA
jgi:SAM-dependent methyltransferase